MLLENSSIEVTAKDASSFESAAPGLRPSAVFVPWLPGEAFFPRLAAVRTIASLGLDPVPHISARRIKSRKDILDQLERFADASQLSRILLVGGDPTKALGPYEDSLSLINDVDFSSFGIETVGLAGHPEGHPNMRGHENRVLQEKISSLSSQNVGAEIVTQFSFDADQVAAWVKALRILGIDIPIAIGVPGPSKAVTLMKYAARCGVGVSAKAVKKYGFSVTRLLGNAGPEAFVQSLTTATKGDEALRLHVYPFGGFADMAAWFKRNLG